MSPKVKKKKVADTTPSSEKRLKRSPVELAGAFGHVVEDVSAAVDWPALRTAFDDMTAPRLWSLGATHAKISARLPLRVRADVPGCRREELQAFLGLPPPETAGPPPSDKAAGPFFVACAKVVIRETRGKGRGWFAEQPLAAGTLLLLERPLVGLLDAEWRDNSWADCDSADTTALGLELAKTFSPSLQHLMAKLHPSDLENVPAAPGVDSDEDDEEVLEAHAALQEATANGWSSVEGVNQAERERLQAVVRLNSLGFYTSSDLLCHSGNFSSLTGSGLFALASGFNHSCEPNVSRYSVGDITAFVTNRSVEAGEELCISYVETDLLCAPRTLRAQSLNRDFTCACPRCTSESGLSDDEASSTNRRYLNVDATVQAELALLPPEQRVEAVNAALQGEALGSDDEEGEEEEGTNGPPIILGKDAQELRVVQAMAYMQQGKYGDAVRVWRRLAAFTSRHCPPFDENMAVFATQAALSSLADANNADKAQAKVYATAALDAHRISTGVADVDFYSWRFAREVALSEVSEKIKSEFWDLVKACLDPVRPPVTKEELMSRWAFYVEEIPEAYTGASTASSSK